MGARGQILQTVHENASAEFGAQVLAVWRCMTHDEVAQTSRWCGRSCEEKNGCQGSERRHYSQSAALWSSPRKIQSTGHHAAGGAVVWRFWG